jgi:hypothetical protein
MMAYSRRSTPGALRGRGSSLKRGGNIDWRHIDLSLCTISVESLFTNKMKWNFHNDYVPEMQEDLVKIPLSYTHYKIDPAVGVSIWKLDI